MADMDLIAERYKGFKKDMKSIEKSFNILESASWPGAKELFDDVCNLKRDYDITLEFICHDFSKSINTFYNAIKDDTKIEDKTKKKLKQLIDKTFSQLTKDIIIKCYEKKEEKHE